jgi:hypothetical protein
MRKGPLMNLTPQRDYWTGEQTALGDAWTLHKGGKVARCALLSHLFGWELRLTVGDEFLRSQVCRSSEDVLNTHEAWRAAMLEKGWVPHP